MIITSSLTTRFFVTGEDKYLKQYDLWPQDSFENLDWRKPPIQPNEEYVSHSIGTKCFSFSLALKKLATGGIQAVCLSQKLPFFYAAGVDGSIFVVAIDDG